MKLRIKGSSVRFRLTRSDVGTLIEQGQVDEVTRFPAGQSFGYSLKHHAAAKVIEATFRDGVISIVMPTQTARIWAASEEAGIKVNLSVDGMPLAVAIEKDFPCLLDRPLEDDGDTFGRDDLSSDADKG
jgi:hypothetical protein